MRLQKRTKVNSLNVLFSFSSGLTSPLSLSSISLPNFLFFLPYFSPSSSIYLISHLHLSSVLLPTLLFFLPYFPPSSFFLSYFPPSSFSFLASHLPLSSTLLPILPYFQPSSFFYLTSHLPLSSALLTSFFFLLPSSSVSLPVPTSFLFLQSSVSVLLSLHPVSSFLCLTSLFPCLQTFNSIFFYTPGSKVCKFVKNGKSTEAFEWFELVACKNRKEFDFVWFLTFSFVFSPHVFSSACFLLMFSPHVFSSCFILMFSPHVLIFYFFFTLLFFYRILTNPQDAIYL